MQNTGVHTGPHSDHSSVYVNFKGKSYMPRGPGSWIINTKILEEVEYQWLIERLITKIEIDTRNTEMSP